VPLQFLKLYPQPPAHAPPFDDDLNQLFLAEVFQLLRQGAGRFVTVVRSPTRPD